MKVPFTKYHALGNDYLVVASEECSGGFECTPSFARAICERTRGFGADGVLFTWMEGQDAHLRIWNPDGSEAEKSGNGLRILARFLSDTARVSVEEFSIHLPTEHVRATRMTASMFRIEMGRVRFLSKDFELHVDGEALRAYALTVGNPHCVIVNREPSEALAKRLGPYLERDPRFPQRTNVQFVAREAANAIRIEIWERGAGYTSASGSSSAAAAAVARALGWVGDAVEVRMPGGQIRVDFQGEEVAICGETTKVGSGVFEWSTEESDSMRGGCE